VFGELVENISYGAEPRSLQTFLHRLAQEQARFRTDVGLGDDLLTILFRGRITNAETTGRLASSQAVRKSVRLSLEARPTKSTGDDVLISEFAISGDHDAVIAVNRKVLRAIVGADWLKQHFDGRTTRP